MRHRGRMQSRRDESGEVRHIHHELRPDLPSNFCERLEVDDPRVGARTGDDHLWFLLTRDLLHLRVVDATVLTDAVMNCMVEEAGEIHGRSMREMTALRKIQSQDDIARLEEREIDRCI